MGLGDDTKCFGCKNYEVSPDFCHFKRITICQGRASEIHCNNCEGFDKK